MSKQKRFRLPDDMALYLGCKVNSSKRYRLSSKQIEELEKTPLFKARNNRFIHSKAKVLIFDIETLPIEGYFWGLWKQNINPVQIKKDWCIVCWSAKWLFEDKMYNACLTPKEAKERDDRRITQSLWRMFDEADIIVAHNLNKFDEKRTKTRFLKHRLGLPSPYQRIDTLAVARRQFQVTSNRLNYLAKFLDLPAGEKMDTDFQLWVDCSNGDKEQLKYMQVYCDHDISMLEETYLELRPYVQPHPNIGLIDGMLEPTCPSCGGTHLEPTGTPYRTYVNEFEALRCGDCGSISRRRKNSTPLPVKQVLNVSTPR